MDPLHKFASIFCQSIREKVKKKTLPEDSSKRNNEDIQIQYGTNNLNRSSSQVMSKPNMPSQENLKQSVADHSTKEKFKSKDGALESMIRLLEIKDPVKILQSIDHEQYLVLFKDGDELEQTVLELISCN